MLGLAFAADPLYDTFCRVTGYGGTTRVASEAPDRVLDREITIRFDANVNGAPLKFRPLSSAYDVHPGEHNLAAYEVTNTSTEPVNIIASYNVTPHEAGVYFSKLECFCFQEQVIQPGEVKKLPVVFFISPDIDETRAGRAVSTITLSYTYFQFDDWQGAANSASLERVVAAK